MRILSLFLSLVLTLNLTACTITDGTNHKAVDSALVVDAMDRSVSISYNAERIISCNYSITSTLIAMGKADQLVGVEDLADTRPIYLASYPDVVDLPVVISDTELNINLIISLEPDLVILPTSLKNYIDTLEDNNITTIVVDIDTYDGFLDTISLIGSSIYCGDRAKELTNAYKAITDITDTLTLDESVLVDTTSVTPYTLEPIDVFTPSYPLSLLCIAALSDSYLISREDASETVYNFYWKYFNIKDVTID